jgi:hypothetical protein
MITEIANRGRHQKIGEAPKLAKAEKPSLEQIHDEINVAEGILIALSDACGGKSREELQALSKKCCDDYCRLAGERSITEEKRNEANTLVGMISGYAMAMDKRNQGQLDDLIDISYRQYRRLANQELEYKDKEQKRREKATF